jgi:hypothetical protein
MERIQIEADQFQGQAREEVKAVREKGENNSPTAIERIIAIVISG